MNIRLILPTLFLCSPPATGADNAESARRRTAVVEAYERARNSVVNIAAVGEVEVQRWGFDFFGDLFPIPMTRRQQSVGSGFILHEDGYIGTNAHVVSAGTQLSVTLADGSTYEAQIIGRDMANDLAVIRIEADRPLQPITLGRSDDLMIGEPTIAVGNSVGLQNTVTTGVISALHRELEVGGRVVYQNVIQTDASINPGNSGGPLLNALGEMIGINTAVRTDAQNIGFAIPVDQLGDILPAILDSAKVNKVVIGMRVSETQPPKVTEVLPGGPADRAGVKAGDEVVRVDNWPIDRGLDFYVGLLKCRAGQTIHLTVRRQSGSRTLSVELTGAPKPDGRQLAQQQLGLVVADVRDDVARRFRIERPGGVIVIAVEPGSPAAQAGLQPGDLLITLGQHWIADLEQLGTLMADVQRGELQVFGFRRAHRGRLYDLEARLYAR